MLSRHLLFKIKAPWDEHSRNIRGAVLLPWNDVIQNCIMSLRNLITSYIGYSRYETTETESQFLSAAKILPLLHQSEPHQKWWLFKPVCLTLEAKRRIHSSSYKTHISSLWWQREKAADKRNILLKKRAGWNKKKILKRGEKDHSEGNLRQTHTCMDTHRNTIYSNMLWWVRNHWCAWERKLHIAVKIWKSRAFFLGRWAENNPLEREKKKMLRPFTLFNMRHKSGRQRVGLLKNTQGFSFHSVLGTAKTRWEFTGVWCSGEKHLWEAPRPEYWLPLDTTLTHLARLRSFVYRQCGNSAQGRRSWDFMVELL